MASENQMKIETSASSNPEMTASLTPTTPTTPTTAEMSMSIMTATPNPQLEAVIMNNQKRLIFLASELEQAKTFKRAAMELGLWCKDPRAYLEETEEALFACIQIIRRVAPLKGYNLMLGWYVLCILVNFVPHFKRSNHGELIRRWFKELSKLVTLYRRVMKPCPASTVPPCAVLQKHHQRQLSVSGATPESNNGGDSESPVAASCASSPLLKFFRPLSSPVETKQIDLSSAVIELPLASMNDSSIIASYSPKHEEREFNLDFNLQGPLGESLQSTGSGKSLKFYCVWKDEEISGANFEWPCDLAISLNGTPVKVERKHMVHVTIQNRIAVFGVDLPCTLASSSSSSGSSNVVGLNPFGPNRLQVVVSGCVCSMEFIVQLFEARLISDVVKQVQSISKQDKENQPVQSVQAVQKSLNCPFTNQRMMIPVKSLGCGGHADCFDLYAYLIYNRSVLQWRCPVCNVKAPIESIRVDGQMEEILAAATLYDESATTAGRSINSVLCKEDGKFEFIFESSSNVSNVSSEKKRMRESFSNGSSTSDSNSANTNTNTSANTSANTNANTGAFDTVNNSNNAVLVSNPNQVNCSNLKSNKALKIDTSLCGLANVAASLSNSSSNSRYVQLFKKSSTTPSSTSISSTTTLSSSTTPSSASTPSSTIATPNTSSTSNNNNNNISSSQVMTPSTAQFKNEILTPVTYEALQSEFKVAARELELESDKLQHAPSNN